MTLEQVLSELRAMRSSGDLPAELRIGVFGSLARAEGGSQSDIDILLDPPPQHALGLFELAAIQRRLQDRFRRPVDLTTKNGLHPALRSRILAEAVYV